MSIERQPTASEVLDLMDRLQRDENRRNILTSSWELYQAAVAEGLTGRDGIDVLARCMQELHDEDLIAHGLQNAGVTPPPVWDGAWIQQLHQWRVTAKGRRDASLFRAETSKPAMGSGPLSPSRDNSPELHDVFIAHASEDKDRVARPLAQALTSLGWSVWLDELQLTIGDSLSRRIDSALGRSRFGVVVLSPAFFAKEWPQRELAGLAARELASGSKVILPVWHNVDHNLIAQRSPILADRLGALTSAGVDKVAQEVSLVLGGQVGASRSPHDSPAARPEFGSPSDGHGTAVLPIPTTDEEQANLIGDQPEWWEYRLYAGVLMQGRLRLEDKWHDHELRLPRGPRRVASDPVSDFLSRETNEMRRFMEILDRIFDPKVLEQAFGAPGESGDSQRIVHVARGVIKIYESMMDWAAELRSTRVSSDYEEILELTARMADGPIRQAREFIQLVADQIARIPILVEEAKTNGATVDSPMQLELALNVELDPDNQEQLHTALDRLR